MKPPICHICHKRFQNEGGLIYFAHDVATQRFLELSKQPGFVGHPPNAAWFCAEHFQQALQFKHLTLTQAVQLMKKTTEH